MPTLNWIGKDSVVKHHNDVPFRTLDKQYTFSSVGSEQSADIKSDNKIIHGDNLEALKALLPEYEGRIKCIYIDPPYNTGNENWVYNDNVNSPKIQKWLGQVVGKEAEDLSRHDKWLCMMYPRLSLLRQLLSDDGAIFISIDDNEQANLKLICDEIFGVGNLVANLIWSNKEGGGSSDSKLFRIKNEHILCYAKFIDDIVIKGVQISNSDRYKSKDQYYNVRGPYYLQKLGMGSIQYSNSLDYEIEAPDGSLITPKMNNKGNKACWRWSKEKYNRNKSLGLVEIKKDSQNIWTVYSKQYMYCDNDGNIIERTQRPLGVIDNFSTTQAAKTLKSMNVNFDYSKPYELIEYLIDRIYSSNNTIILDSFAGSGTTAHAVLNLNKQDGGNRKFILVEMEDYAESITAERVRRVINGYGDGKNAVEGTGGSFSYYELGEPIMIGDYINENQPVEKIKEYIWYSETHVPYCGDEDDKYYLGNHNGAGYYFYYEKGRITTLSYDTLDIVEKRAEQYIIYADQCLIDKEDLLAKNIVFKKIPRDIRKF